MPPGRGGSGLLPSILTLLFRSQHTGKGSTQKNPCPRRGKGTWERHTGHEVDAGDTLPIPRSFEFWHRAPSTTMVAATLSKPLSRECLFNPLSARLSTWPGSGVYVAREPHLPRNENVSHCTAGRVKCTRRCSGQKYTPLCPPCNPKCGENIPRSLATRSVHRNGGRLCR